jgi:hypothetical protein
MKDILIGLTVIIILCITGYCIVVRVANDQAAKACIWYRAHMREYQLVITPDSIIIFDNDRRVGDATWQDCPSPVEKVLLIDNLKYKEK